MKETETLRLNGSLNDFYQIANFARGLRSLTSRDKPAALFWLFSLYLLARANYKLRRDMFEI